MELIASILLTKKKGVGEADGRNYENMHPPNDLKKMELVELIPRVFVIRTANPFPSRVG